MKVRKSSCLNCAARVCGLEKDTCDYKETEITDMNDCCDDWEPNDEELLAVVQEENADLRAKLAAAEEKLAIGKGHLKACELQINKVEKERDTECADTAVLRSALERVSDVLTIDALSVKESAAKMHELIATALEATPSDSAGYVKKLVNALKDIAQGCGPTENIADHALNEWYGVDDWRETE